MNPVATCPGCNKRRTLYPFRCMACDPQAWNVHKNKKPKERKVAKIMAEENSIQLSAWQQQLADYFRAPLPGIVIETVEEQRAYHEVCHTLQWLAQNKYGKRAVITSSACKTTDVQLFEGGAPTADRPNVEPFFKLVSEFAKPEKAAENGKPAEHAARTLIIFDPRVALDQHQNVRVLREALFNIRATRKTIILMGTKLTLPAELQPEFVICDYKLPTVADLERTLTKNIRAIQESPSHRNISITETFPIDLARACAGLTQKEALGTLGLSIARFNRLDNRAVELALNEKANIVKRSNVLEYTTVTGGLDDIGGLNNFKNWVRQKTPLFLNPTRAREYGCSLPGGMLLCGVSGSGKSYASKLLAAHWKIPLLTFDVGRAFGSLVGESEKNVREVINLANACKPCVVRVDEIEKALGGDSDRDGGTTGRVKSTLLTWLVEKPDEVFVVATANDLDKFRTMPELLNKHRFSECFFVDLPAAPSRQEILSIHLKKRKHPLPEAVLGDAVRATVGFSGAELEAVVKNAVDAAFFAGKDHPDGNDLSEAARHMVPLSRTMSESINRLRTWVREGRARMADDHTVENEMATNANGQIETAPRLNWQSPD